MKLTKTLPFICFSILLAVMSQATFAKEFPDELRVVAKCLADELHPDTDEAMKKSNLQEIRLEMQTQKFDLAKIKSDNTEIQHLASEALTAASDVIRRLETIDGLPKPNNWKAFGAGFLDGFLLGAGLPPTGTSVGTYQSETAKQEAIDSELSGLMQAIERGEIAQRLLPRVAKPYVATPTKSSNNERISVRFHTLISAGGLYVFTNNGESLEDCILEISVSGATGNKATFCCFVEKWGEEQTYYLHGGWGIESKKGEAIGRRCAEATNKVKLTLLSPGYSTSVEYEYGQKQRDDDYAEIFADVKLTASYTEATSGIFDNWARFATIYMDGFSRLPPCTLSVTFDGEGKTYSKSDSGWTAGNGWTISGNNKSEDKCKSFSVEVTFPNSTHTIKKSFSVP